MEIGPYEVVGELGRGEMGVVYEVLASDGYSYALKRLRPEHDPDDEPRLRQIAEVIKALTQIEHPGVVRSIDGGWHGDGFYLLLELIEGPSLGDLLASHGPLPADDAATLCATLARTLDDFQNGSAGVSPKATPGPSPPPQPTPQARPSTSPSAR